MKRLVFLLVLVLTTLSLCSCADEIIPAAQTVRQNSKDSFVLDDTAKDEAANTSATEDRVYVSGTSDTYATYDSLDTLIPASKLIVEAEVLSQETYYHLGLIHTLSKVKIVIVYSGDVEINDTIQISQTGGFTTYEEWLAASGFQPKEGDGEATYAPDTLMAFGMNGYYPVEKGDRVLLFLQDPDNPYESQYGEIYSPLGGYQGVYYPSIDRTQFIVPNPYKEDGYKTIEDRIKDGGIRSITEEELLQYTV
jgi:hypothetical protein